MPRVSKVILSTDQLVLIIQTITDDITMYKAGFIYYSIVV